MLSQSQIEHLELLRDPCLRHIDIARRLGISENVAKNYASRIYTELGADNRGHAVQLAIRRRFLAEKMGE